MQPKSDAQYQRMLTTPIPRLVMSLALPTILSTMITVIYNTADTYFVSQINKSASAAVGAVFAIMSVIQAVGFGFAMGSSSLISLKLGEKDNHAANTYCASGFYGAVGLGAVIGVLGLVFLKPILNLLCSDTMLPHARSYAAFILMAAPISCATFVLNNALRAQGQSRLAMWGMTAGGLLNMALDPIFIFPVGLNMGAGGAALATAVSQCVSFCILISFFLRGKSIVSIHPKYISRRFADYSKLILTGIPTVFRQGLGSIAAAVLNIQAVAYGGDALASAATIANKIYMLARNFLIGLGQGFQPVASFNYQAKKYDRVKKGLVFTTTFGLVFIGSMSILSIVFAEPIISIFQKQEDVIRIGAAALRFTAIGMMFMPFSVPVNMLYQSIQQPTISSVLSLIRSGAVTIPLLLIGVPLLGLTGIQIAQPTADVIAGLISIPFILRFLRKNW